VTSDEARDHVYAILRARNADVPLGAEVAMGSGGVNLDSIALVEVLLECEDRFGVSIAAELLDRPSLTVGMLVERIEALLPA
jgi:acyl carrier protein